MSTTNTPPFSRRIFIRSDSSHAGSITAGIIRDFVKAMDEAGIPDNTQVTAHRENTTLSTTSLSVVMDDYLADHVKWPDTKEPDL